MDRASIIKSRSFLKSFVEKIEVGDSEVNMYYTIPVPPDSATEERWELYLSDTTVEGEGE